ncbi:uncharacterized protein LOC129762203 [Toxorhynchites rutilus septentrionalis]|uniref:uncharacterized protein LOC129762203 n=1 Tax=Toxorhynchites rutilus septentrionalis TaxID=329112 RepID=UPI00247A48AA|nr:uncharacterized protein LOC129762203 [Toxorhynchites rutilus septentrionalis]
MGIIGLVTFLTRLPGGCRAVNVLDEIRNSGRKEPLIAIDILTLICSLCGPIDEQIYGCRNQFAWTYASKFCDSLIGAGARLVFFIDGKVHEGKYKHWIQRQEKVYAECLKKLDNIPTQFKGKNRGQIQGNVTKHAFIAALISAARKKGILITTYDVECDREIAMFAKKHDALAVFTGDSDYLIYEGKWRVWSGSDLNLETMRTYEWDKEVLRNALKLEWSQMPFFAVIAGNDHFKHRPSGICTFYKVAQRVKELNLKLGITKITIELYEEIFGRRDENLRNSFEDGITLYDLNITVKRTMVPPEIRHFPNYAVCILRNIPGTIRLPCLDLREAEYSQIALQIYRRQVGLLFRHRPIVFGQTLTSQVFIKPNHYAPYKIIAVTPMYPPSGMEIPSPEELYSFDTDASSSLVMTKLRILCWLVSDKLTVDEVFNIHPNYLLDVLTLYFLVENNLLDTVTADIILIAIHHCLNNTIPLALPLQRPRKPNVQTCFLYLHFYAMIYFCAEVVGLRKELDSFFLCKFDGVYFNGIVDQLRHDFATRESTMTALSNLRLYTKILNVSEESTDRNAFLQRLEQSDSTHYEPLCKILKTSQE